MIVKLFDRTEIVVSKDVGDKLVKSIAKSSDGYVTLNGMTIRKTAIALIKPGGYSEADAVERSMLENPGSDRRRIGNTSPTAIGNILDSSNGSR